MSPNQLISQQPYTLSYFITDPNDNNTYYVRAVVYDATTGEILDTQNLTRQTTNTHLFSKRAQAPGDSSGRGRKIIVIATAYDDSGYTSKSAIYQEQSENYIVTKPGSNTLGGGGFGGVDYNVIKDIFVGEFDKWTKKFEQILTAIAGVQIAVNAIPTDKVDLSETLQQLKNLSTAVSKIPLKKYDLDPISNLIQKAIKAIDDKEVTETTDLAPISTAIDDLKSELGNHHKESINTISPLLDAIKQGLPSLLEKCIKEAMAKQKFTLEPVGLNVKGNTEDGKPTEKPAKVSFDIKKLTGQQ